MEHSVRVVWVSVWYALSQKIITNKVGANINSEVLTIDIRDIQCTYPGLGTSLYNVCYAIAEKTVVNHWFG